MLGAIIQCNMKTRLRSALLSLFLCIGVHAGDTWGHESLQGVKTLSKVSQSLAYCSDFLFDLATDLNRDVELKLRIARIPIDAKASDPWMLLNIHCLPLSAGGRQLGHAVHVQLSIFQYVLIEDTKKHALAAIWQSVDSRTCSTDSCQDTVRSAAKDLTDEFLKDLLKANESK